MNAGNGGATFELFRISKIDTVRIFIPVPETYSEQISNGLKATLELTALPGKQFQGRVVRSSHAIDTGSHTLLTEIDVPNPTGQLLPGAYAEVHLRTSAPIPSLIIPSGAVLYQSAGPQVATVIDNNEIALKKVALGRDFGDTIEITGGISKSDAVVASPPDYLVDGMRVEVQTPKS